MLVVEAASEDATESCAANVHPHVVRQNILRVVGVEQDLEHSLSSGQCWVQACTSEGVDIAEAPEDEADGGNTIDAKVGALGVLAGHVEDEEHEDEGNNDFHVSSRPV